jgi:WD40 repeat protein
MNRKVKMRLLSEFLYFFYKIKLVRESKFVSLASINLLVIVVAIQMPVIGYCDDGNSWLKNIFQSKGKNMSNVASKVAEISEKHTFIIRGLDFSQSGGLIAVVSEGQTIRIWDWKNNNIIRSLEKADAANAALTTEPVRFSPDGRWFAACHDRAANNVVIRIWSANTWELVHDITDGTYGGCNAIGFTSDGKYLLRATQRSSSMPADNLVVYRTVDWKILWGIQIRSFQPSALAISPDGKYVALGGSLLNENQKFQRQIVIVDMEKRVVIRTISDTVDSTFGQIAWSPDGSQLAAIGKRAWDISANHGHGEYIGGPDTLMLFDVHTGKKIAGDQWSKGDFSSLRFTSDGKYLIEGNGNGANTGLGVRVWDGLHHELLQEIAGNVGSLAISQDGRYFAVGDTKKTTIWQLK